MLFITTNVLNELLELLIHRICFINIYHHIAILKNQIIWLILRVKVESFSYFFGYQIESPSTYYSSCVIQKRPINLICIHLKSFVFQNNFSKGFERFWKCLPSDILNSTYLQFLKIGNTKSSIHRLGNSLYKKRNGRCK